MKRVLVTGAGGTIGIHVIKYLLSEGLYEITALDLKNKRVMNRLKRFRKRINIIYGDIVNRTLMEALVKDHDIIINLATCSYNLANMKKGLADIIDYKGCENIVRAINYYNPDCHLFFASTTSLYKETLDANVNTKIKLDEFDYYNKIKLKCENLIKEKLKNYTIYRIPLVLSNLKDESFNYNIKNDLLTVITKEDAAYAFVRGIKYKKELNKKIFNLGTYDISYKDLMDELLSIYGYSFKYIAHRIFLEKNYYSPRLSDKDELNKIINYQNDTITNYFNRLRTYSKNRNISKSITKVLRRK